MMIWHHILVFLAMGGFGMYVWSAYGIVAVVMMWIVISAYMEKRKVLLNREMINHKDHKDNKSFSL